MATKVNQDELIEINRDELIAEYERLGIGPDDPGLTSDELCQRWKLGKEAVRRRLLQMDAAGLLLVGRRTARSIDGRPCQKPTYRLKPAEGKKRK